MLNNQMETVFLENGKELDKILTPYVEGGKEINTYNLFSRFTFGKKMNKEIGILKNRFDES